jgi:hypothetical protein
MPDQHDLQAIAEGALLSGLLDSAAEQQRRELEADAEWTTPKHVHAHRLVEAFAAGIIGADPWHHGYKLPPDFEGVVNWMAFNIQKHFDVEVPIVSLIEMKALFTEWAHQHPGFLLWNETDQLIGIAHRYQSVPDKRDFIDLGAAIHNAVIYLRNEHRRDEAFEREFEAKHGPMTTEAT